jgi:hypothetical protein
MNSTDRPRKNTRKSEPVSAAVVSIFEERKKAKQNKQLRQSSLLWIKPNALQTRYCRDQRVSQGGTVQQVSRAHCSRTKNEGEEKQRAQVVDLRNGFRRRRNMMPGPYSNTIH